MKFKSKDASNVKKKIHQRNIRKLSDNINYLGIVMQLQKIMELKMQRALNKQMEY